MWILDSYSNKGYSINILGPVIFFPYLFYLGFIEDSEGAVSRSSN